MPNIKYVGDGNVVLIAGGSKVYTDIAARFVKSEKPLLEIIDSPYSSQIVNNIITCGHGAALEFDFFIFGIEGYSRVTETQLVRKRHASYLIKSGRAELNGKRAFNVIIPPSIEGHSITYYQGKNAITFGHKEILEVTKLWYDHGIALGKPEEDLRYIKQQGTEFRAIVGMNAHGLRDFFKIRCCKNAQAEIRDLATKMLILSKQAAPDLFNGAGASCVEYGYCPENSLQNKACINKIYTKNEMQEILKAAKGKR